MIDLTTVKVIIAGGREFDDYDYMRRCLDGLKASHFHSLIEVVSGHAKGADRLGERWAEEQKLDPPKIFKPDYTRYGRFNAPKIRNQEMADYADVLCAFWDGRSGGTKDMIGKALRGGLEIHLFRYKSNAEKRSTKMVGQQKASG